MFDALSGLDVLNISLNKMWLTSPPRNYLGELFSSLSSLTTLVMDSLPFGVPFPIEFGNVASLEHLKLRANMTNVTNETFAVFSHTSIKTLTIWSGFLVHLDALSFAHFGALATLGLSYNPVLGFDELSTAWYGLQFTNISELYLMYTAQFETTVVTLEQSFFEGLEKTNITKVVLDGNNIVTIAGGFHCYLPKLKYLSVSRNRLVQVQNLMDDIGLLSDVQHIDASFQSQRTRVTEEDLLNLNYGFIHTDDTVGALHEILHYGDVYRRDRLKADTLPNMYSTDRSPVRLFENASSS